MHSFQRILPALALMTLFMRVVRAIDIFGQYADDFGIDGLIESGSMSVKGLFNISLHDPIRPASGKREDSTCEVTGEPYDKVIDKCCKAQRCPPEWVPYIPSLPGKAWKKKANIPSMESYRDFRDGFKKWPKVPGYGDLVCGVCVPGAGQMEDLFGKALDKLVDPEKTLDEAKKKLAEPPVAPKGLCDEPESSPRDPEDPGEDGDGKSLGEKIGGPLAVPGLLAVAKIIEKLAPNMLPRDLELANKALQSVTSDVTKLQSQVHNALKLPVNQAQPVEPVSDPLPADPAVEDPPLKAPDQVPENAGQVEPPPTAPGPKPPVEQKLPEPAKPQNPVVEQDPVPPAQPAPPVEPAPPAEQAHPAEQAPPAEPAPPVEPAPPSKPIPPNEPPVDPGHASLPEGGSLPEPPVSNIPKIGIDIPKIGIDVPKIGINIPKIDLTSGSSPESKPKKPSEKKPAGNENHPPSMPKEPATDPKQKMPESNPLQDTQNLPKQPAVHDGTADSNTEPSVDGLKQGSEDEAQGPSEVKSGEQTEETSQTNSDDSRSPPNTGSSPQESHGATSVRFDAQEQTIGTSTSDLPAGTISDTSPGMVTMESKAATIVDANAQTQGLSTSVAIVSANSSIPLGSEHNSKGATAVMTVVKNSTTAGSLSISKAPSNSPPTAITVSFTTTVERQSSFKTLPRILSGTRSLQPTWTKSSETIRKRIGKYPSVLSETSIATITTSRQYIYASDYSITGTRVRQTPKMKSDSSSSVLSGISIATTATSKWRDIYPSDYSITATAIRKTTEQKVKTYPLVMSGTRIATPETMRRGFEQYASDYSVTRPPARETPK